MAKQTSKITLATSQSLRFDTLDGANFYDVTLSGNGLAARAHSILNGINYVFKGDTLRALGSINTHTGGVGNDLLIS